MQCPGNPSKKCLDSICSMWVNDDRCPNLDWLGPYESVNFVKRNPKKRPDGPIRIEVRQL